jgi:hypothetical protein
MISEKQYLELKGKEEDAKFAGLKDMTIPADSLESR